MTRIALAVLALLLGAGAARADCADHSAWNGILGATVDEDGFVDYGAIRSGKAGDLDAYLAALRTADLSGCTTSEKLAFWINAYNALTIRQILDRPKLDEISDDFGLFDEKHEVAGARLSLNDIEHRVLRSDPKKGGPIAGLSLGALDPRIHFALVCAAIDCPRLLNAAYDPSRIEAQLRAAELDFANSPKHLRIEDGRLVMSTLMKWYADDFRPLGGVAAYLSRLTDPSRRPDEKQVDAALASGHPGKTDFRYDWTLNSVENKPR